MRFCNETNCKLLLLSARALAFSWQEQTKEETLFRISSSSSLCGVYSYLYGCIYGCCSAYTFNIYRYRSYDTTRGGKWYPLLLLLLHLLLLLLKNLSNDGIQKRFSNEGYKYKQGLLKSFCWVFLQSYSLRNIFSQAAAAADLIPNYVGIHSQQMLITWSLSGPKMGSSESVIAF